MTNDTNTLNGALRELGETMASNLTQQGVPSTYDEGLTTLANKILRITPSPAPSYDGVELSSDVSVLSYSDGDSATLTAQLLDGSSSASVSAETVEFFADGVSLGTALTDSNGVATKVYESTGVGDVSLTAEVGSFVSETYSIEDYYFADLNTYTNNDVEYGLRMPFTHYQMQFDIMGEDNNEIAVVEVGDGSSFGIGIINDNMGLGYYGDNINETLISTLSKNIWKTLTIEFHDKSADITVDGNTYSVNGIDANVSFLWDIYCDPNTYIRNLKIKPL